ncbi:MAG TPA: FtsX-like permease family protein, partial [Bryobacteraceae bacterium]|nr:FtsX-like permease family protein [Bryobacteraceae bacterium]
FPGQDAVGKHLLMDVMTSQPYPVEIAGVVGDTRDFALDLAPEPTLYIVERSPTMDLVVRAAGDPALLAPAIRRVAVSSNPDLAADEMRLMEGVVAESLAQRRFALLLLGGFAGMALGLAVIGIYGVVSYSVTTRTRELGLRMALGATRGNVVRLLIQESLVTLAAGIAAGCVVAFALTRLMASLLYGVGPTDPLSYAAAAVFLASAALAAAYLPARRATTLDPMQALREQ